MTIHNDYEPERDPVSSNDWLIKFRKAKTLDTLDIMHIGAEKKYYCEINAIAAINIGAQRRAAEISRGS